MALSLAARRESRFTLPAPMMTSQRSFKSFANRLGENGFEFITPEDDWQAIEEDEDWEPGPGGRVLSDATELLDSDLRTYKHLRQIGMHLMSAVIKSLPKELILQAARDLRLLDKKGVIVCDTEDEMSFIMDRAIHDIPWPEQRFIEIYHQGEAARAIFESASASKGPHSAGFFLVRNFESILTVAAYG